MTSRRQFLAGLAAASLAPIRSWSAAGAPDFLAAALFPDGLYRLAGLSQRGEILFTLPLPERGHAAARIPNWRRLSHSHGGPEPLRLSSTASRGPKSRG